MPSRIHTLRFFRDTEACLRDLAEANSRDITSDLVQLADKVSGHATELKRELIADGLIS